MELSARAAAASSSRRAAQPPFRFRSIRRLKCIHDALLFGKVNTGDVPIILGMPVHQLSNQIHHRGVADFDLCFLFALRLGKAHGIGGILLADANGKLLRLRLNQELDVLREMQSCAVWMLNFTTLPAKVQTEAERVLIRSMTVNFSNGVLSELGCLTNTTSSSTITRLFNDYDGTESRNHHKTQEAPPQNCSAPGLTYVPKKPECLISSGFQV